MEDEKLMVIESLRNEETPYEWEEWKTRYINLNLGSDGRVSSETKDSKKVILAEVVRKMLTRNMRFTVKRVIGAEANKDPVYMEEQVEGIPLYLILMTLVKDAYAGSTQSAKLLLEYGFGKPKENIELGDKDIKIYINNADNVNVGEIPNGNSDFTPDDELLLGAELPEQALDSKGRDGK